MINFNTWYHHLPQVRPHPVIHPVTSGLVEEDGMEAGLTLAPEMAEDAVTTEISLGVNPAPWS